MKSYKLDTPLTVGGVANQIVIETLNITSVSINVEPRYVDNGVVRMEVCLADPVSGYPVSLVYEDAHSHQIWASIADELTDQLLNKLIADTRIPAGGVANHE